MGELLKNVSIDEKTAGVSGFFIKGEKYGGCERLVY
jgi:hypothetical protein